MGSTVITETFSYLIVICTRVMKLSCSGIARKLVDLLMSTLTIVLGAMTKTDKGRGSYTTRGVIMCGLRGV